MSSVATLTYTAQNPVTINWGDGVTELYPAAPPPTTSTVHHTYSSAGPWTVTISDNVTGMFAYTDVTCSTCDITGAQLNTPNSSWGQWTIGPLVNGSGGPVTVNWGDATASDVIASGGTGTHQYNMNPATGSMGPYTVTVTDPAVPGCSAAVTGGNDPANYQQGSIIIPPVFEATCVGGTATDSDVVTLHIEGFDSTAYSIDWLDGSAAQLHTGPGDVPHTYPLPAGMRRIMNLHATANPWFGTTDAECAIRPIITSLVCTFVPNCVKADHSTVLTTTDGFAYTFGPLGFSTTLDWGDGTSAVAVTSGTTASHTYPNPGVGADSVFNVVWAMVGNPNCIDLKQLFIAGAL